LLRKNYELFAQLKCEHGEDGDPIVGVFGGSLAVPPMVGIGEFGEVCPPPPPPPSDSLTPRSLSEQVRVQTRSYCERIPFDHSGSISPLSGGRKRSGSSRAGSESPSFSKNRKNDEIPIYYCRSPSDLRGSFFYGSAPVLRIIDESGDEAQGREPATTVAVDFARMRGIQLGHERSACVFEMDKALVERARKEFGFNQT